MKKTICIILATAFAATLQAAVPLAWNVETTRAQPAAFDCYRGETLDLRASLFNAGSALDVSGAAASLYWQTNGMGEIYWSAPATAASNVLSATWAPTNDVGATSYNCFIGVAGEIYRAAFRLRMLPSPGAVPSELDLPAKSIDFATVTVLNAPYYTQGEVDSALSAAAQSATNYVNAVAAGKQDTISDLAAIREGAELGATALQSESDPVWTAEKGGYATVGDFNRLNQAKLEIGDFNQAMEAADGRLTRATNEIESVLRSAMQSLNGIDGWLNENASLPQDNRRALAGKQDNLPYPTNAIPYAAISGKPTLAAVATSNSYNDLDDTPDIPSSAADIGAASESDMAAAQAAIQNLRTESQVIYRLYSGSNVVCEVTNYNSVAHPPTMRLLQLDTNGVYITVWTETNGLSRTARAATNYTDSAVAAAEARAAATYAPRGWSATTSGLGADAPAETTWISTPTTVIAGGYEYQKAVTAGGTLWILASNGMTAATNKFGFLDISTADGTSVFRIEKTDSYLVGADPSSISVSGNTVTVGVPVIASDHPYLRYAASLTSPVTWYKEEDGNIPASVAYNWSGSSGGYVCTITTAADQGFFYFEFLQPGSTKIINNGATDLSAGITYKGTTYYPVPNGGKLEFVQ